MSSHLRDDNECQNCGYTVDVAYCSKCGQKNTETRQPFHHLFTHFIEDLVHYDGAFWKTIKHLLFRPSRLTKEYLQGKRQTYVAPVKLYIFISFVTFFLLNVLMFSGTPSSSPTKQKQSEGQNTISFGNAEYTSIEDFEAQELAKPEHERIGPFGSYIIKKMIIANERNFTNEDLLKGFINAIPKVLFIYMPIFAFWLWLFHGKKRWYFFDHGIFTLHYFSFLLMLFSIGLLLFNLISLSSSDIADFIMWILFIAALFYPVIYFFIAHRKMYGERFIIAHLKSIVLFFINIFLMIILLFATLIYAFITVH